MYLNTFKLKFNDFYREHIFGVMYQVKEVAQILSN